MDETRYPVASEASCAGRRRRFRRGHALNRIIAGLSWGLGFVVCGFSLVDWTLRGGFTPEALINVLIVGIGTALGGWLALRGDGDVLYLTGADEGQRAAVARAALPAFSLAYLGLFVLWTVPQLWPTTRDALFYGVGVLLLLILVVYLVAYVRAR
ncbi:MAG TPA: hypothetical protein VFY89_00540 [Ktedonobacterales bacterium]